MKFREGSTSDLLFKLLAKASEYSIYLEEFTYSGQLRALKGISSRRTKNTLAVVINRLKNKGIIEQEIDNEGKIIIKLTSLGKKYLGDDKDDVWDGKYRIVVWDVPERKRRIRDLFRRKLKDWKFRQWQKSVWVSKRNVTVKLRKMITEYEMDRWVAVVESDDPSLGSLFV